MWEATALLALAIGAAAPAPTFTKDVAPIVFANCSSCHRPGGTAPFSLLTYADVKSRARLIASATARRFMPPWKPEPGAGEFRTGDAISEYHEALRVRPAWPSVQHELDTLLANAGLSPRKP